MQLIVVYNVEAGSGHMSREEIERLLRGAGHEVEIIDRKGREWLARLGEGADAVVAAGGDGTVHEVIHDVAGKDIPVAILPIGTANNIAHSLGYRVGDPLEDRIADWPANEQRIGVAGAARDGWKAGFIESVGVGAFAELAVGDDDGTSEHTAKTLVSVREALIEKLLAAAPLAIELEIDGETITGEYLLAEVLNMRFLGPRLLFAPDQAPGRAVLTVCALEASQRDVAAHWIATGSGDPRRFELGRGRVVQMRTSAPMHVDGKGVEQAPTGDIRLEAGVRAARLWV